MWLHNFLVDCRERNNKSDDIDIDKVVFQEEIINSNSMPVQTGNDLGRVRGRFSNEERCNRVESMLIRDYKTKTKGS